MTAVQNGSENVVALLLALGAKTELVTKDTGLRAIDLAHQLKLLQLIILLSVSSGNYAVHCHEFYSSLSYNFHFT